MLPGSQIQLVWFSAIISKVGIRPVAFIWKRPPICFGKRNLPIDSQRTIGNAVDHRVLPVGGTYTVITVLRHHDFPCNGLPDIFPTGTANVIEHRARGIDGTYGSAVGIRLRQQTGRGFVQRVLSFNDHRRTGVVLPIRLGGLSICHECRRRLPLNISQDEWFGYGDQFQFMSPCR